MLDGITVGKGGITVVSTDIKDKNTQILEGLSALTEADNECTAAFLLQQIQESLNQNEWIKMSMTLVWTPFNKLN